MFKFGFKISNFQTQACSKRNYNVLPRGCLHIAVDLVLRFSSDYPDKNYYSIWILRKNLKNLKLNKFNQFTKRIKKCHRRRKRISIKLLHFALDLCLPLESSRKSYLRFNCHNTLDLD